MRKSGRVRSFGIAVPRERQWTIPACPGTGIIAGGAVRAVMDAAGVTDVISKSLGSSTSVNVVRATFDAVTNLMDARAVAQNRGKTLKDMWG